MTLEPWLSTFCVEFYLSLSSKQPKQQQKQQLFEKGSHFVKKNPFLFHAMFKHFSHNLYIRSYSSLTL